MVRKFTTLIFVSLFAVAVHGQSQEVALSFEEGTGNVPVDSSANAQTITSNGTLTYSSDSKEGGLSFQFKNADSDWLEIQDTTIGDTEEFTLEFWYQMDEPYAADFGAGDYWKFITNKVAINNCDFCWGESSFAVVLGAFDAPEPKLTARKWSDGEAIDLGLDTVLEEDVWYKVTYEIRKAAAGSANPYNLFFQLSDSTGVPIEGKSIGFNLPMTVANNPVRIGGAIQDQRPLNSINGKIDGYTINDYSLNNVTIANSEVATLTFEEGTGNPPADGSVYNQTVASNGTLTYSDDAKEGSLSYSFKNADNDWIEVSADQIGNSDEFSLRFWYQMDEPYAADFGAGDFWKFITNKVAIPGCDFCWGEGSFAVVLGAFDAPEPKLTARKWSDGESIDLTLDHVLVEDAWYEVIYEIRKAPEGDLFNYYLLFQINDGNGDKIESKVVGFDKPMAMAEHPVRIGGAIQEQRPNNSINGKIDNYRLYNYSIDQIELPSNEACPDNANLGASNGVDECTVVYMNFDNGDLTNQATLSDNGVANGSVEFFPISVNGDLGQALYLNNESVTDSAFVTIPDNDNLDLTGAWTMETWFFLNSYGESAEDHRFAPVILWKPGSPTFDQGNYFMETFGNTRWMSTGYAVLSEGYPSVQSEENLIEPQNWYHVTMIRDTVYHSVVQLMHDANLNLIASEWFEYDPILQKTPITTDRDIHIGFNGGSGVQPSFFDGFMDELRISNNVRNYEVAPLIVEVAPLPNLDGGAPNVPPLTARIGTIGSTALTGAMLHYQDGDTWKMVEMAKIAGDEYSGQIPETNLTGSVSYYISATNDAGQTSYFPQGADDAENPAYLSFSIVDGDARTMALSFEEGNGITPVDSSIFAHQINVNGIKEYSSDAVEGDLSYVFNTDSDEHLEIATSVVGNSENFSIDFWYKMTADYTASYDNGDFWKFITNKVAIEGCAGCWGENTFEIILGAFDSPTPQLTAGKWTDGEQVRITLDSTLVKDEWYHVLYEIREAPEGDANNYYLLFQMNDANDDKIQSNFIGFQNAPAFATNPMRIGAANQGRAGSSSVNALIDHYQAFNYSTGKISIDAAPSIASTPITNQLDGVDDYPVSATVTPGLGAALSAVDLVYRVDGGDWVRVAMTNTEGDSYASSIPNQSDFSIVEYFVESENIDGFKSTFPAEAADGLYAIFGIEVPNTEVLSLEFEESDSPLDASSYGSRVEVFGGAATFDAGKSGSQSILLDGTDDYMKVFNPVIASGEEFAVDFWFNAKSYDKFWSFIMNQPSICEGCWGENAFEVLYGAFDDADWKLTAGAWNPTEGSKRLTLPHLLQTDAWYHVLLQVEKAPADSSFNYLLGLELRDANDDVIDSGYITFNEQPVRSGQPMVIGKAGGVNGFPDYFDGNIDRVKVYNYAALETFITSSQFDAELTTPDEFTLSQNYPNPFNPSTNIRYTVPVQSDVTLEVFNLLGQRVATLVNTKQVAGSYTVRFDASSLASGLYIYRLSAGSYVNTQKMLLIK